MKRTTCILIALLAAAAFQGGGCERRSNSTGPAAKAPARVVQKAQWTAEEIAQDPVGYLQWSDQQVASQIALNEEKLRTLASTRSQFEVKRDALLAHTNDVENVRKRLAEAYQRAEDEDRWPVRMANRTFTREKAQMILAQTETYIEQRRPLVQSYEQFLKKLDGAAAALRADIAGLRDLREKISMDMAQVKLNQGMAEVEKLRKTESQLRSMSGAVAALSGDDDPLKVQPTDAPSPVSIDEILK